MKGNRVIVRAYGGEPLVRRVWEVEPGVVYITDDVHLQRLLMGDETVPPAPFPQADVFKYRPKIAGELEQCFKQKQKIDWERLELFETI